MIVYIVFAVLAFHSIQSSRRLNLFSIVAASIPGIRNSAGKDTLLYLERLRLIQEDQIIWDYEPILSLILYSSTLFSKNLSVSWFIANLMYTLIVITIYNLIYRKIKESRNKQTCICINIFFVTLIIDAAFNGMRVGLMIPFALYFLMTEKISLMVLAVLSHFSAFFLVFTSLLKKYRISLLIILIMAFFFLDEIQIWIELNERINSKIIRYSQTANARKYSGLMDVGVFFLILISANIKPSIRTTIIIIFVPFVLFHILKLYEFYGIFRLYRLLIISGIYLIYKKGVRNIKIFALSTLVFTLNFVKQLILTYGDEGGFLPFK